MKPPYLKNGLIFYFRSRTDCGYPLIVFNPDQFKDIMKVGTCEVRITLSGPMGDRWLYGLGLECEYIDCLIQTGKFNHLIKERRAGL